MKKLLLLFFLVNGMLFAQQNEKEKMVTLIKNAALDYGDGFYSADVSRMERAIHPELNKVRVSSMSRTGRNGLSYTTYTQLIELTKDSVGSLEEGKRNIKVDVLDVNEDVALVKVTSAKFNDYLQLIKINDNWKIINVVWNAPNSIPDFKSEAEKSAVLKAANLFVEGFYSADSRKLEIATNHDFNLVTFNKSPKSGRLLIGRQRYESIIENTLNSNGKLEEYRRHYKVNIFDIMDGMAMVETRCFKSIEYLQMAKINNEWKVLNAISKPIPVTTVQESLPVVVNEQIPDFTLPVYGGGEFSPSKLKGKNILLVFPRGLNGPNSWCPYCQYQYLDLSEMDKKLNLRKKYNLEIAFVLPYKKEMIDDWFNRFNETTEYLDKVKNTKDPVNQAQKEGIEFVRKHYSKEYKIKKGEMKPTFPVLIDDERKVSIRYRLFTNFWNSVNIEQNIPAIYLIGKDGNVEFKYISQMTYDRLDTEKIIEAIKKLD